MDGREGLGVVRVPDLEVLVAGVDLQLVVDGQVEVGRGAHHQRVGQHQGAILRTCQLKGECQEILI